MLLLVVLAVWMLQGVMRFLAWCGGRVQLRGCGEGQ